MKAKEGSQRLVLGSRFGMSMKMGIPYSMVSEVVEFDETRRIAWQTRGPGNASATSAAASGATSSSRSRAAPGARDVGHHPGVRAFEVDGAGEGAKPTEKNMAATLERIEQLLTGGDDDATA